MEFKFKRKYTSFFIIATLLHLAIIAFWIFFPNNILHDIKGKQTITLLALVNCELLLIFYLGLVRRKYFAYYNKLVIKRSLIKNLSINYDSIHKIKEKNNDSTLLGFGTTPSFKIYYRNEMGKNKKYTVRSDNNDLLIKIIKNEINIARLTNTK